MNLKSEPESGARLERVQEIDEGAYQHIKLMRPVEKAASPIIDHNIELTEAAIRLKRWYGGKCISCPHELLGTLLDPKANEACDMLVSFVDTAKHFRPGAFPGHCHAVRELAFTTTNLIRTLMTIIDSSAFTEALHRVGLFFATLADPANGLLNEHDLNQRIDARLSSMVESFAEISRAFRARERERDLEIAFRNLPPVTAEDVKSAAESAADKIVAAIDNGTAKVARAVRKSRGKGRKPQTKIDIQEAVWNIHERTKKLAAVKNMHSKGIATKDNEFQYAKAELMTFGIQTVRQYNAALVARIKHHSNETCKRTRQRSQQGI